MSNKSPKPCDLSREEIFNFAETIAKELNVKPGQNLDSIVSRLNGKIEYIHPGELTNATATISVKKSVAGKPPDFVIRLSSFVFPLRERFYIAHELGHLFLHSQYGTYELEAAHNDLSVESNLVESQANDFANAFLIPKKELDKQIKNGRNSIIDCAAYFNVPLPVMESRINDRA